METSLVFLKRICLRNSDKIGMGCQSHAGTWNSELYIISKLNLNTENKTSKKVKSIQWDLLRILEVCILALNMEDFMTANYPEMHKERRKVYLVIFPSQPKGWGKPHKSEQF